MVEKAYGDLAAGAQLDKPRINEAGVADLDHVPQRQPGDLRRQKVQESGKVLGIERLAGHERPEDRAEAVAQ